MYVNSNERKEVKAMTYETPKLTALTPAINAIQGQGGSKIANPFEDSPDYLHEGVVGYADWE
jgi:hypothetical protein